MTVVRVQFPAHLVRCRRHILPLSKSKACQTLLRVSNTLLLCCCSPWKSFFSKPSNGKIYFIVHLSIWFLFSSHLHAVRTDLLFTPDKLPKFRVSHCLLLWALLLRRTIFLLFFLSFFLPHPWDESRKSQKSYPAWVPSCKIFSFRKGRS